MTFAEFCLDCDKSYEAYVNKADKIIAFAEAAQQEFIVNHKEAELKVISESGTLDDLLYLEEANEQGAIEKLTNSAKKLLKEFLEWIDKLIESMKDFFNKKETKDAMKAAEEAVKENPELKKKTIEVEDIDQINKICDEYQDKIDKRISLIRTGKASDNEKEIAREMKESFGSEMSKAGKIGTAVGVGAALVTAGLVIARMEKNRKRVADEIEVDPVWGDIHDASHYVDYANLRQQIARENAIHNNKFYRAVVTFFQDLTHKPHTYGGRQYVGLTPEENEEYKKARSIFNSNYSSKKEKEKAEKTMSRLEKLQQKRNGLPKTYMDGDLGSWTHNKKDKDKDDETKEEKVSDVELDNTIFNEDSYLNNLMTEMAELSGIEDNTEEVTESTTTMADYLNDIEAEIIKEAKESEDMTQTMTAEEYLEAMENEIFGSDDKEVEESEGMTAEEYLEALENEILESAKAEANEEAEVTESEEEEEGMTAEEYLEAMENEIFGSDDEEEQEVEESEGMTAEEYLDAMEKEILG